MTLDEVRAYLAGETIECLVCGRRFRSLGIHLGRAHGFDVDAYRIAHGIPLTWPLEAAGVTEVRSAGRTPELREQARRLGRAVGPRNAGRPATPRIIANVRALRRDTSRSQRVAAANRTSSAALAALGFGA